MTRLDKFLLMLLAGLGWCCVFALVGLGLLKGVPGNTELVGVFAAFGFVAGALLVPLHLRCQPSSTEPVLQAQRAPLVSERAPLLREPAPLVREPTPAEPITATALRAHA